MTHKKELKRIGKKLDRLKRSSDPKKRQRYHAIEAELKRIGR